MADSRESSLVSAAGGVPFVHLHTHTHFSLLDGAAKIDALVKQAKALGQTAMAITDHGNMFGVVEFYSKAKEAGIKPIIGYEAYVAPGDRTVKQGGKTDEQTAYHLLLLAKNLQGYKNLLKLASTAYIDGFYYRPRIDKKILAELKDGLICASACLAGEVPQAIMKGNVSRAEEVVDEYLQMFGSEDFYLEIQDHGIEEQRVTNPVIIELAKRKGVGLIATNDIHYIKQDDARAHEILVCINTGKKLSDDKRLTFGSDQFYVRSGEEMLKLFPSCPEAISNTVAIADRCDLKLDFSKRHAPVYHPEDKSTPEEFLRNLVYENAKPRYPDMSADVKKRIEYELQVICSKGFASYFLIVWDFVNWCHKNRIPCGARGSGGGCVVGYCLGIIAEDPLEYDLLFERFMDPDRDEMPDIDIDLCQDNRLRVIDYVRQKYGHVAQIITFNTMAARAVIRDVGRVMDMPLAKVDQIAKFVPSGPKVKLKDGLETVPELKQMYDEDADVKFLIDIGLKLEGLARNCSVHAAGVVVAENPLEEYLPLYKSGTDVITQFEGKTVEKVGLLKFDFLGLRTLTTLSMACTLVKEQLGVDIDLNRIPLDDQKVLDIFGRGETKGVFQFESDGMRDLLMRLKPTHVHNLIAANALYRPGPMMMIDDYIARKHGAAWDVPHPIMREVLEETFGIMVYQEQVMRILNRLGDLPLRRSYNLIKAISKKKNDTIEAEYANFIKGCDDKGVPKKVSEELFELIRRFGGYGFNKSHSTRYAVVAYQTAFMKAYYPLQFMAALLTLEMGDMEKTVEYIQECKRMGIPVLPPDINESKAYFTVVHESDRDRSVIRFALSAVKGVGAKAVESIVEIREQGGRFESLYDFCCRVDGSQANKGVLESLIKCGAFDSTGDKRRAMVEALEETLKAADTVRRDAAAGQMNLFEAFADTVAEEDTKKKLPNVEWSERELLSHEKDTLGFYLTSHPVHSQAEMIDRFASVDTVRVRKVEEYTEVLIGGLIEKVRKVVVKPRSEGESARQMAILLLEDLRGRIELVLFPDDYERLKDLAVANTLIFAKGTVDKKREDPSIRVSEIFLMDKAPELLTETVIVKLDAAGLKAETIERMHALCAKSPGKSLLTFIVRTEQGHVVTVRAGEQIRVAPTAEFRRELHEILGNEQIMLQPMRMTMAVKKPAWMRKGGNGAAKAAG